MIGRLVGKYRLIRQLGKGGMGEVYLAKHELLGRSAAVKILSPSLTEDDELVERFFREALATSQINHPGIIQVYDYGYDESNAAFLALELLEGETLDQRLRREKSLAVETSVVFLRQMASAISAAHAVGVVHRDLKPANAFVVADADVVGGERIKILDFGIAKLVENEEVLSVITVLGALLGTPAFMSPEQCDGSSEVDIESDVYSLGCMVFRMLTGRPPFKAKTLAALVSAHCTHAPPRLTELLEVPHELDQLVDEMLAKQPSDRPTVDGVRRRLKNLNFGGYDSAIDRPAELRSVGGLDNAATQIDVMTRADDEVHASETGRGIAPLENESRDDKLSAEPVTFAAPRPVAEPLLETQPPLLKTQPPLLKTQPPVPSHSAAPALQLADRGSRRWIGLAWVGGALLLIAAVVTAAILGGDTRAGSDSQGQTTASSQIDASSASRDASRVTAAAAVLDASIPVQPVETPSPDAAFADSDVSVTIRSHPAGAAVRLSPRGQPVGATPYVLERSKKSFPPAVWLTRRGYKRAKLALDPKRQTEFVELVRRKSASGATNPLDTM